MKLETIPLVLGALIALVGLALLVDARLPDRGPRFERRRRIRLERSRGGETLIGLGILAMAAAVIGRDSWRYGILAILVGTLLLLLGAWMNRRYLGELIFNRGASRRRDEEAQRHPAPGARVNRPEPPDGAPGSDADRLASRRGADADPFASPPES